MILVPPRVLAAHRLARYLDNSDVPGAAEFLAGIHDPQIKSFIARSMRSQAISELIDATSDGPVHLTTAQLSDLIDRVLRGSKEKLKGVFPDDILAEAFG